MQIDISFPGGQRVNAQIGPHLIATDQSAQSGGAASAPEPYLLFLASLGTCAGFYVLKFCQSRSLPTEGLRLTQQMAFDPMNHQLAEVRLDIHLPGGFPEKYREAVVRAADQCAVKRVLADPPEIIVEAHLD